MPAAEEHERRGRNVLHLVPHANVDAALAPDSSATSTRYRLVRRLGRGGMADVFLAVTDDASFEKLVVVKRPRESLSGRPELVQMFLDEARIAARLNHPNVVQTLDSGSDGTGPFLVMEYLDGQPLHHIAARRASAVSLEMRLAILSDVLSGLHHAHELVDFDGSPLTIVHRDVSPHNVFVTYDGQVKVVDFGIARAAGSVEHTEPGVIKGKAGYMAPEQACGGAIDRRADVFSVGVMLYEVLTGRSYWRAMPEQQVLCALTAGVLPPVRVRDAPAGLEAICARALAVDPADRFATAEQMQNELDALLERMGRPVARRLGTEVARLFADERAQIRQLIEAELAQRKSDGRTAAARSLVHLRVPDDNRAFDPDMETPPLASIATKVDAPSKDLLDALAICPAGDVEIRERTAPVAATPRDPEHRRLRMLLAAAMLVLVGSAIGLLLARASAEAPPNVTPTPGVAPNAEPIP